MIGKVWQSLWRFWETDRGLSIFLFIIVLVVFVLPPLGAVGVVGRFIFDIFFSLLLISGIASMSVNKKTFVVIAGIVVIALVFRWTDHLRISPTFGVLDSLASITSIILFCMVILSRVLKKGPITIHRIEGAIAAYLLLGLAWATAYELIEYLSPGSFTGSITVSGRFSSWI